MSYNSIMKVKPLEHWSHLAHCNAYLLPIITALVFSHIEFDSSSTVIIFLIICVLRTLS
uniref:Uncharacterized protein n=1 Tax=Anguilla anguilla TaxID=7936 RepID=A0A0E9RNG1_ANGAN